MVKKLLIKFVLVCLLFMVGCNDKGNNVLYGPNSDFRITSKIDKEEYDINDVYIKYYLGFGENHYPSYMKHYENINGENFKYVVCIKKDFKEKIDDKTIKLFEILDFHEDKYIYTKEYDEEGNEIVNYLTEEIIYLPKELFESENGYIYISLCSLNKDSKQDVWIEVGHYSIKINYTKLSNGNIKLYREQVK